MIVALVTLAVIAVLLPLLIAGGFMVLLDRRDRRERDERGRLVQLERDERARLVQRLQAPHVAVAEHHAEVAPRPVVPPGADMPMSDVEMAERQEMLDTSKTRQRLAQWIEDVENGVVQIEDGVIE